MNSQTASSLDDSYDKLLWAGEEYILKELNEETGGLPKAGIVYSLSIPQRSCIGRVIFITIGIIIAMKTVARFMKLQMQKP